MNVDYLIQLQAFAVTKRLEKVKDAIEPSCAQTVLGYVSHLQAFSETMVQK